MFTTKQTLKEKNLICHQNLVGQINLILPSVHCMHFKSCPISIIYYLGLTDIVYLTTYCNSLYVTKLSHKNNSKQINLLFFSCCSFDLVTIVSSYFIVLAYLFNSENCSVFKEIEVGEEMPIIP